MEDREILARFEARDESAIACAEAQYGTYCRTRWVRWSAVAACVAVLLAATLYRLVSETAIVYPDENAAVDGEQLVQTTLGKTSFYTYSEPAEESVAVVSAEVVSDDFTTVSRMIKEGIGTLFAAVRVQVC